ncbi:MAG: arsenate reductase ArsC [Pirellulales bacterium]|nr:arsenate reductase ArsC [Pirellulales bacterium]
MNSPAVLFLCTGNSCRSQMAEGWARHFHEDAFQAYSAGIVAHGINPHAVKVMQEAGVDISTQPSKTTEDLPRTDFDLVVTVCAHADEHCPVFAGARRVFHRGFDDPPKLAKQAQTDEEQLAPYRRVRDEIRDFVRDELCLLISP